MSIILDALRRGRGRHTPAPDPSTARTDAVLQTLGYGRFSTTAPANRFKRLAAYVAGGSVAAILLWFGVVWLTRALLTPGPPDSGGVVSVVQRITPAARGGSTTVLPAASTSPVPAAPIEPPPAAAATTPPEVVRQPVSTARSMPPPAAQQVGPPARAVAPASGPVTMSDDHFRRAVIAQRMGDFEGALVHYSLVLKRDDLNVEAHNNLGLLYRDKGLMEDAVREFQRAIAIEPRYTRARNNLGVVYLNQRKLDAAAAEFHAVLAIDPKSVDALVNLSNVDKEAGRLGDARSALVRALAIAPRDAEAHYNFALLEDEAGNKEQALIHYRAFLQHGAAGHPVLVGEVRRRVSTLEK